MKWVVLGDIGQVDYYHLGDEAMTEVAVEMLAARGASGITLVASNVETAERCHGQRAVKRINFRYGSSRDECEHLLHRMTEPAAFVGETSASSVHSALRGADYALIAGGGNMNSQYVHLLYERLAFARIAHHLNVPLFVTSQTVGPVLRPRDAEMVAEILNIAVCFGAREAHTARLLRSMTDKPEKVVHTLDDAVLLNARDVDREAVAEFALGEKFIVASFAAEQGTSGIGEDEYTEKIVILLDDMAERHSANVALVPHAGSLNAVLSERDQGLNTRIAERSQTGRLIAAPMPTARQNIAIVERALCSVSSRYHPVVFGPQAGIATVGVALSTYSSVRMRGALENVGLERYVVPSLLWERIGDAADDAIQGAARRDSIAESSAAFQACWWDELVRAAFAGKWTPVNDLVLPPSEQPAGDWSREVEAAMPAFNLWGEQAQLLEWANQDLAEFSQWRERALKAEDRKVVRVVDRIADFLKKAR